MQKSVKRTLAVVLCLILALLAAACDTNSNDATSSSTSKKPTSSSGYSNVQSKEPVKIEPFDYFSTDIWQNVPMVSQAIINQGYKGGEGCQWMTYISFDQIEGKTAYACVDVGGILKSTDGGKSWVQSATGMKSHGSAGATVDPKNVKRVIAIGVDSSQKAQNGLYLSTDEGVTWQGKCLMKVHGHRDFRRQVAFDESSYDSKLGYCKTVYWVTENVSGISKGIYKSTDGGESWKLISSTANYAGSNIAVHPKTGAVYISNNSGLFKSTDGGKSFVPSGVAEFVSYMCMTRTNPDKIYLTGTNNFFVYDVNTGKATRLCSTSDSSGYPDAANFISVSPADPNKMVLQSDRLSFGGQFNCENYYSNNGGKNWYKSSNDYSGAFMPYNARQNPSSFHPTDPNVVIKLGGDFIMRSTDGGKSFKVSNDGNSAIYIGGKYNFNVNNTNILAVASQDYNGAYTVDGGKTWKYIEWGYGWGGYCYGAYALDKNTVVVGNSKEWYNARVGVEIKVTHDGGNTVVGTGITTTATPIGIGALGNDKIACFADYRTTDGGYTWNKMSGCTAVYCIDYKDGRMFGLNGKNTIVVSSDNGATWEKLATVGQEPKDMAFDHVNNKLFVSGSQLSVIDMATKQMTSAGSSMGGFTGFAIDPGNTQIMYGLSRDWSNAGGNSVWRSIDGGKTWHTMNLTSNDSRLGTPDGGRVSDNVRVNAKGEAFFSTNCRGMWKLVRPNLKEKP